LADFTNEGGYQTPEPTSAQDDNTGDITCMTGQFSAMPFAALRRESEDLLIQAFKIGAKP